MAPHTERNNRDLALWRNGTPLGHSWWVFADQRSKERFRKLQREGAHLGLQQYLEHEVIARICDGELKAFGIAHGGDTGPVEIPEYFFSKTAEVDWDAGTVTSLGQKFEQVTVEGTREAPAVAVSELGVVDPQHYQGEGVQIVEVMESDASETGLETIQEEPASEGSTLKDPTLKDMASVKPTDANGRRALGRPSKISEIEKAIELILMRGVDLAAMPRPQAYAEVRKCAAAELRSNTKIGFTDPVIQRALFRRFGHRR